VNGIQFASHLYALLCSSISGFADVMRRGYFITASDDGTAKLIDTKSLEVMKTYEAGKAVNAAALSPILPHVILGGGQVR
jgi:hypothetical protein